MRVAVLHTRLSGYLAACLRECNVRADAEFLIYALPSQGDAPFDSFVFAGIGEIRNRRKVSDADIEKAVRDFGPDAILVSGWADKGYVNICRSMRQHGIPVIAGCDTQWRGSWRQRVASLIAPWHIQKAIDALWVTGERQATLARALGYNGERLWDGYYACDWEKFARRPETRSQKSEVRGQKSERDEQPSDLRSPTSDLPFFLFVGRYVDVKGIDTLIEAYRMYREKVEEPWALKCAGAGPLRDLLVSAGAEDLGFVQPSELPKLMRGASAFVLPSRFEPWGVVAHEAGASGLPLILSDACGAGVHLLRDLHNGYLFPTGDADALVRTMVRMHGLADERRAEYGSASFELSKQYTPQRWAETLVAGLERMGR